MKNEKTIAFSNQKQRKSFIKKNPEFTSVQTFVEFLMQSGRKEFSGEEMLLFAGAHCLSFTKVRDELELNGFVLERREIPRRLRGYKSRDDDRWFAKEY